MHHTLSSALFYSPSPLLSSSPPHSKANVFVIGQGTDSWISLPKGKGIYLNALQAREKFHSHAIQA